jgi:alkylated DNA repair dioxygenase AlkB
MYTCDLCDKMFSTKQNFHRHIERLNRCILNFYTPGMTMGWHTDHARDDHFTLIYYIIKK